jgi:hypothetical protein
MILHPDLTVTKMLRLGGYAGRGNIYLRSAGYGTDEFVSNSKV